MLLRNGANAESKSGPRSPGARCCTKPAKGATSVDWSTLTTPVFGYEQVAGYLRRYTSALWSMLTIVTRASSSSMR